MLIIGERINSTRPKIQEAIKSKDASLILKEANLQIEAGAIFVDVNCAMGMGDEMQYIDWVISVIQSKINDVNICIDSPNYLAIDRALKVYAAKGEVMINSITGEDARMKNILPLVIEHKAKVIALTIDDSGMPETAQERFNIAKKILERVKKEGMKEEDIYFDPLIRPISTEPKQAKEFLESIPLIKGLGKVKTVCGLSNISFGLPDRSLINSIFLSMAIQRGLDAAIVDPLDKKIFSSIKASGALLGEDDYCAEYIKAFREGKLI